MRAHRRAGSGGLAARSTRSGSTGARSGFAFAITALVGLAVGLAPALRGTRPTRAGSARGPAHDGSARITFRRSLVVAEVALALVLLVEPGFCSAASSGCSPSDARLRRLQCAHHADRCDRLSGQFRARAATQAFFESTLDAVRGVPGVTTPRFTSQLPLSGDFDEYGVQFESAAQMSPNDTATRCAMPSRPMVSRRCGIPLRQGRLLGAQRSARRAAEAVLLSESLAKRGSATGIRSGERLRIGAEIGRPIGPGTSSSASSAT